MRQLRTPLRIHSFAETKTVQTSPSLSLHLRDVDLGLPSAPDPTENEDDWPDEVILSLSEAGEPSLNEEPVTDLPRALTQLLKDAGKRKLIVTLQAHPKTSLEKVTQTLEALAKVGIANVTFTVRTEENF